jgi:hypothetical protein
MMEAGEPRRLQLDDQSQRYLASAFAVVVSLISLWVAFSANDTQERLLAASVWPTLEYGTGNRDDQGRDMIILEIDNNGVGPARLRGVQVLYDGKVAANSIELLRICCGLGEGQPVQTITSGTRGRVLKAGDRIEFMMLPIEANDAELWKRFNRERFKVEVRACYCSVLDACWMMNSTRTEPEPVRSCPALSVEEEWNG